MYPVPDTVQVIVYPLAATTGVGQYTLAAAQACAANARMRMNFRMAYSVN